MIQKDKIVSELQKQIKETENEQVKLALSHVVADILQGVFDISIW